MLISATGHAQTAADDSSKDSKIIVTGVFNAKKIEDAPIAITAITALEISQQVPVSAADLLKKGPWRVWDFNTLQPPDDADRDD
jgi:outer membrane receptor for ferrienterochelin and colicin